MNQQFDVQPGLDIAENIQRQDIRKPRSGKKEKTVKPVWREYTETIIIALLAAVILRVFVVSAYHVSSGSMEDTLMVGDYIFVNKLAYEFSPPKLGDVIVFDNPYDPGKDYIKRIIAAEGQTVEIYDKTVYVDGAVAPIPINSKYIDSEVLQGVLSNRDNFGPITVPTNQYFVLGDNRDDSQDSRFWGGVEKSNIKGKAIFVYFSYAPDAGSPTWESPYILEFFQILYYNLRTFPQRLRVERIGNGL